MTGINSAVTGKFSEPQVIMTGITSRFISGPGAGFSFICKLRHKAYFLKRSIDQNEPQLRFSASA
jgi:hypothetical protein